MNKIFIIVKGWIILQMTKLKNWWLSLFTKDEPDINQNLSTTLESTDTHLHLSEEEIELDKILSDEDPILSETILEDDTEPSEFYQTTDLQQDLELDSQYIIIQESPPPLLYDGRFDAYFNTPDIPVPLSVVNEEIWTVLVNKLPEDYTIPSTLSQNLYR